MRTQSQNLNKKEFWKAVENYRKNFSRKQCMAPTSECDGEIIKAHTIQKNRGLSLIAEKKHVYRVEANLGNSDGPLVVREAGINEATIFNGFCSKHDREIFDPIETKTYISSPEQNFLFTYRAVCRETYAKISHLQTVVTPEQMLKIRPDIDIEFYENFYMAHI